MVSIVDISALRGNPYNAEIFLYKSWKPKGFFQFEIIIDVFALSALYEYPCYRSTASIHILILTVWGSTLDVRICRLNP